MPLGHRAIQRDGKSLPMRRPCPCTKEVRPEIRAGNRTRRYLYVTYGGATKEGRARKSCPYPATSDAKPKRLRPRTFVGSRVARVLVLRTVLRALVCE